MTLYRTELLVTELYSKLLPARTRPLRVIEFLPRKLRTVEDSMCNTASVDRPTVAPVAKNMPKEENREQADETDTEREEMRAGYTQLEEKSVPRAPRE